MDIGGEVSGACLSLLSSYYGVYVVVFDCTVNGYFEVRYRIYFEKIALQRFLIQLFTHNFFYSVFPIG